MTIGKKEKTKENNNNNQLKKCWKRNTKQVNKVDIKNNYGNFNDNVINELGNDNGVFLNKNYLCLILQ